MTPLGLPLNPMVNFQGNEGVRLESGSLASDETHHPTVDEGRALPMRPFGKAMGKPQSYQQTVPL